MPRPVEAGRSYIPGLDGLRAVAVLMVIAYHLNVPGASGGNLGVGVFFTLSGYLITDLLLSHWRRYGNLGLAKFWLRRARRLLPALFLMLAVVSIWVAIFDAGQLASVRRQVITAVFYVGNWSTIAQHGSYFARFATPLPLDHLWSLAIEEQFYLVWPWVIWVGVRGFRTRKRLALATLVAAVASAVLMGQLFHPGADPTRVYEGTDTRAFGLLIGAALAMILPTSKAQAGAPADVQRILDRAGIAALVVMVALVWRTNAFSGFLYPGGFIVLSVATAVVIAAVVSPASRLGAALGWRPLRWIGVRSYGIYLWQAPIIVLANPNQTTFNLPRAVLEVGATFVIADLSWRFVEEPIRHGALGRLLRQMRAGAQRLDVRRRGLALGSATALALLLAVVGLAGALPVASSGASGPHKIKLTAGRLPALSPVSDNVAAKKHGTSGPAAATAGRTAAGRGAAVTTTLQRRTSCRSVVYIGDSTSEGSTSTDYIPNPAERLPAQLADFGVTTTIPEISNARSIYETFEGQPNAQTVAQDHISSGYNGCWIIAMGTNEVDDVNTGSTIGYADRIRRMMTTIGHQPTLWIDAITLLSDGPYRESDMQKWNAALLASCQRFPNMRVFDWASHAQPRYFIPDGIHYYSPGYVARTHLIAQALATAFPDGAPPAPTCVVR